MPDFLQLDPKSLSTLQLKEICELLGATEEHRETLLALRIELVRRLQATGVKVGDIVKLITRNRNHQDRELLAREWSKALGIEEKEFRRIASQR